MQGVRLEMKRRQGDMDMVFRQVKMLKQEYSSCTQLIEYIAINFFCKEMTM
jgi:hypothetical protein